MYILLDLIPLYMILTCVICLSRGKIIVFDGQKNVVDDFGDLPASFGPGIPDHGILGYIMKANTSNSCATFKNSNLKNFILLIESSGDCTYEDQVTWAQNASSIGVIVYSNENDELITMDGQDNDKIHIPSTFISRSDGIKLNNLYSNGKLLVFIHRDWYQNSTILVVLKIQLTILLPISIFFMILNILCIKILGGDMLRFLKKKFPIKNQDDQEKVTVLPCLHSFHGECIKPWLKKYQRNCPICRQEVTFLRILSTLMADFMSS